MLLCVPLEYSSSNRRRENFSPGLTKVYQYTNKVHYLPTGYQTRRDSRDSLHAPPSVSPRHCAPVPTHPGPALPSTHTLRRLLPPVELSYFTCLPVLPSTYLSVCPSVHPSWEEPPHIRQSLPGFRPALYRRLLYIISASIDPGRPLLDILSEAFWFFPNRFWSSHHSLFLLQPDCLARIRRRLLFLPSRLTLSLTTTPRPPQRQVATITKRYRTDSFASHAFFFGRKHADDTSKQGHLFTWIFP